jgi:hypothetical protein
MLKSVFLFHVSFDFLFFLLPGLVLYHNTSAHNIAINHFYWLKHFSTLIGSSWTVNFLPFHSVWRSEGTIFLPQRIGVNFLFHPLSGWVPITKLTIKTQSRFLRLHDLSQKQMEYTALFIMVGTWVHQRAYVWNLARSENRQFHVQISAPHVMYRGLVVLKIPSTPLKSINTSFAIKQGSQCLWNQS